MDQPRAIQEMATEMQQQRAVIEEQQRQLAALMQEVQRQHSMPAAAGVEALSRNPARHDELAASIRLFNSCRPSLFRGEHGTKVQDWLSELESLFGTMELSAPINDELKKRFGVQCLREEALRWWNARERLVSQGRATPVRDWAEFKQEIHDRFSPRGASEGARADLHRARQRDFRSLSDYAEYVEALVPRIEVDAGESIDAEAVAAFKNGLSDGHVRLALTTAHPKTLLEATRLAIQAEDDLNVAGLRARFPTYRSSHDRSRGFGSFSHGFRGRENSAGSQHRGHFGHGGHVRPTHDDRESHTRHQAPMDLTVLGNDDRESDESREDAGRADGREGSASTSPERGTSSDAEDDEGDLNVSSETRGRKDGCWNCGDPGHLRRDCPKERRERQNPTAEYKGGPSRRGLQPYRESSGKPTGRR